MSNICPICDTGALSPVTFDDFFDFNGDKILVEGLEGSLCDTCGADPILRNQILRNQRVIADAKRKKLGYLSGIEILRIRNKYGLTQKEASELFGGGTNSFSKYERGEVVQSAAADVLLRLVDIHPSILTEMKNLRLRDGTGPQIQPQKQSQLDYGFCKGPELTLVSSQTSVRGLANMSFTKGQNLKRYSRSPWKRVKAA